MLCPICYQQAKFGYTKFNGDYYFCKSCEFLFCGKIPKSIIVTENDKSEIRNLPNLNKERLRRITSAVQIPIYNIVDFGCGKGQMSNYLKDSGYTATAIDQDTEMQLYNLDDASQDAIIVTEVIGHLPNPKFNFHEFERVLKVGGGLYIESTFDNFNIENTYIDPRIGHCSIHSKKSLGILANEFGFNQYMIDANTYILIKDENEDI